MDLEALSRLRATNNTKQLILEARRSQIRQGIADGHALAEKYKDLDCGLGPSAEVGLTHVARTLGVINRGIAALSEQEKAIVRELGSIDAVDKRMSELAADAESELQRRQTDAELIGLLERELRLLKSGVSETADGPDYQI